MPLTPLPAPVACITLSCIMQSLAFLPSSNANYESSSAFFPAFSDSFDAVFLWPNVNAALSTILLFYASLE